MKKSGLTRGFIWTLSIGIALIFVVAALGVVAYNGYTKASLEASYSTGKTETTIKIEKKNKLDSEIVSTDIKQVNFNEDFLKGKKKLNFKEYGPFFGIKKNSQWIRGIHISETDVAKSTWYGTFTKDSMYYKGYFEHVYPDGKVMYQYVHFKVDKQGKSIQNDQGKFEFEENYLIDKENFEKVKLYIQYDIEIPFSFYDFDLGDTKTKIVQKKGDKSEKKLKFETEEKYYALVIGNNKYQHLEKLDAAENDAVVIADVLEKKYGFEVDLLLNADYDKTVNSLFKITDKLKKNDNLLIYYAGHGEIDKAENRGYWLPVDASYELRSKWISNQRIVDRIKATKAKHVLLVADSCFSGTLMRSGGNLNKEDSIDEKYIKRLKNKKTRLVITSGGNEPVVDSVGGKHSLFALKFIDTLKNNNTVINSQILFESVRRYVVANADQTPERAMVHKTGHDGGDFLFFPK